MRKFTSVLLALVLCAALLCIGAGAENGNFAGGTGEADDPYIITDADGLAAVSNGLGKYYKLGNDIDLNNQLWTPIGNFNGTFDGNGHTISGLYAVDAGLFRSIGENGVVKDLTVSGEVAGSGSGIGGIANENRGKIIGCTNECAVSGNYGNSGNPIGGVVGTNYGTITGCTNNGAVSSVGFGPTGGVVGTNEGTVTDCTNTGSITAGSDTNSVGGGIAGISDGGRISKCYNEGSVSSVYFTGGIAGRIYNGGSVESCYNTGAVTGNSIYSPCTGGIVGLGGGVVSNCYNSGAVTGTGGSFVSTGGVVGCSQVAVENCYNAGEVTGNSGPHGAYTGGVVGENTDGEISNCYNTGNVNGSDSDTANTGGVVGRNRYDIATTTNCYYLQQGEMSGIGADNGTSEKVKSKTAEEFASGEVAWLLEDGQEESAGQVWGQTLSGDNKDSYPVLTSEKSLSVIRVVFMNGTSTLSTDYTNYNGTVTFPENPTPPEGQVFDGWYSGDTKYESTTKFNEDTTLIAKFAEAPTYAVRVNGSYAEQSGAGSYLEGASVTVSAGERAGYRFAGWTAEGVTLTDVSAETVTFNMPASNVTLTASWDRISNPGNPTYKPIVEEPENGDVTTSPSRPEAGDTVTVNPKPDEGYEVDEIIVMDEDGNAVEVTRNPDGSYSFTQPEGAVTIEVTFRPVGESGLPFTDVAEGEWFYGYVEYVYENGLMDGVSATTFEPNAEMTRAMVWAILVRIDGETVTGENWAETAREWAMANGVSDGEDANGYVTREQLATMLWRYAGEPASSYSLSAYTDAGSVSDYAATAMAWAVEQGVITGVTDATLEPQGTATRAQCAAMLMRFVELGE